MWTTQVYPIVIAIGFAFLSASCASVNEAVSPATSQPESTGSDVAAVSGVRPPPDGALKLDTIYESRFSGEGASDQFKFMGEEGQEVQLFIQGLTSASMIGARARLTNREGTAELAVMESDGQEPDIWQKATPVVTLPETGSYNIVVTPPWGTPEETRYRIMLKEPNYQPETADAFLSVGQTVEGERLDHPHDTDNFYFEGRQGQQLQLFVVGREGRHGPDVTVMDAEGNRRLAHVRALGTERDLTEKSTDPFTLTTTGRYSIRVEGPFWNDDGYLLRLHEVDDQPEEAPARITIGDPVDGEKIDFLYDVDQFRLDGMAGQQVRVYLQGLSGHQGVGQQLEVRSPSNRLLTTVRSTGSEPAVRSNGTDLLALPETGTYLLRVRGVQREFRADTPNRYRILVETVN